MGVHDKGRNRIKVQKQKPDQVFSEYIDVSECFDCPLLEGLTDEQKLEKLRNNPMVARCLAGRRRVNRADTLHEGPGKAGKRAPVVCGAASE
ncbi:MAG: hypothetical protein ACK5JM_01325 [Rhodoblastus sp.]